MKWSIVFVVLVGFLAYHSYAAAVCRDYNDYLGNGELGFCAGVVNYPYYVSNSTDPLQSQKAKELTLMGEITGGSSLALKLFSLLPAGCGAALKEVACQAAFPRCGYVDPFFVQPSGGAIPEPMFFNEGNCPNLFIDGKCVAAVPRFPCKAQCNSVVTMDKQVAPSGLQMANAKCPLASGRIFKSLADIFQATTDPDVQTEIQTALSDQGCFGVTGSTALDCALNKTFTGNLLQLIGFAPNCMKTLDIDGVPIPVEVFPSANQPFLFGSIEPRVQALESSNGAGNCGNLTEPSGLNCADVRAVYECVDESDLTARATVQSGMGVIEEDDVCAPYVTHPNNQDNTLITLLSQQDAIFQGASQAACFTERSQVYKGVYFVPSQPGQPPLAQRIDPASHENTTVTTASCPNDKDQILYGTSDRYANQDDIELCDKFGPGYNNKQCLLNTVNAIQTRFPNFVSASCNLAFREYLCAQAHMKVSLKSVCLRPEGDCELTNLTAAALDDKFGVMWPVPRFPSKSICTKFESECATLFKTAAGAALKPNCDGAIDVQTCANEELEGNTWGCTNAFNSLPSFPAEIQVLADLSDIEVLKNYTDAFGDVGIQDALQSDVVVPTVSAPLHREGGLTTEEKKQLNAQFCSCPYPLVIPDDPDFTLNSGVCCSLPCRGSMHTENDVLVFGTMQMILSAVGLVLMLFMVATWGTFKAKSKQYMTFWLSLCSLNVTLGFFVMAIVGNFGQDMESAWCSDNSKPHSSKDGFSACAFQGMWLHFWATTECFWWAIQAFDLFRKLVLGTRNTDGDKIKYHMAAWTMPIVLVAYVVIFQGYGFKAPSPYCFLDRDSNTTIEWAVFYGYVAGCFLFGTLCMLAVITVIVKHTNKMGNHGTTSSGRLRQKYKMYRTPMLFVLLFIIVWAVIFSFRLTATFKETQYKEEGESWISCLLGNAGLEDPANNPLVNNSGVLNKEDGLVGCGEQQGGGLYDWFLYLTITVVWSQSILIFLVFGVHEENYKLWAGRCGLSSYKDTTHGYTSTSKDQTGSKYGGANNSSYYQSSKNESSFQQHSFHAPAPVGMPPAPPPSLPNDYY